MKSILKLIKRFIVTMLFSLVDVYKRQVPDHCRYNYLDEKEKPQYSVLK